MDKEISIAITVTTFLRGKQEVEIMGHCNMQQDGTFLAIAGRTNETKKVENFNGGVNWLMKTWSMSVEHDPAYTELLSGESWT